MNKYVIRLVSYKKNDKSKAELKYMESKKLVSVMKRALKWEEKARHEKDVMEAETIIFKEVLL